MGRHKLRAEMNKIEKKWQRVSEMKSCFFEKINKIDRTLAKVNKGKEERAYISKIRKEEKKL